MFAKMEAIIGGLVDTSGTTVSIDRPPAGAVAGAADPNTLAVTPAALTPVATGVAAIVVPAGTIGDALGLPAAPQARPGDYRVVTRPDLVDAAAGDLLTVDVSRDAALVGRQLLLRDPLDSSAGAVRIWLAAPVRLAAVVPEA